MKTLDVSFISLTVLIEDIISLRENIEAINSMDKHNKNETRFDKSVQKICNALDDIENFFDYGDNINHKNKNLVYIYKIAYSSYSLSTCFLSNVGIKKDYNNDDGYVWEYDMSKTRDLIHGCSVSIKIILDNLTQLIFLMSFIVAREED